MSVQRWMPTLLGLLVVDVAVLLVAAASGRLRIVAFAAACFAGAIAVAAVVTNMRYWTETSGADAGRSVQALVGNARLTALAWLWGACAMQAVYLTPVTGLKWQHAWQYAAAMLCAAALCRAYASWLAGGDAATRARLSAWASGLATAQAIGGAIGATVLVATGKLVTWRPDWAANQIFLFGALLLAVLAAVILRTQARLRG